MMRVQLNSVRVRGRGGGKYRGVVKGVAEESMMGEEEGIQGDIRKKRWEGGGGGEGGRGRRWGEKRRKLKEKKKKEKEKDKEKEKKRIFCSLSFFEEPIGSPKAENQQPPVC